MKTELPIIPTISILIIVTSSIIIFTPKSASAFCVENLTGRHIWGKDVERASFADNRWRDVLDPGERGCCPGNNKECQNKEIEITLPRHSGGFATCRKDLVIMD